MQTQFDIGTGGALVRHGAPRFRFVGVVILPVLSKGGEERALSGNLCYKT